MNFWIIAGLLGNVLWTNVVMVALKWQFPEWDKKAWAPPVIGLVSALLAAMATGQIGSWESALIWAGAGIGGGSTASSLRDVKVGK